MNIWLLEDDPAQAQMLLGWLHEADHDVRHFSRGQEIMSALADDTDQFELMILDWELPDGTGIEVLEEVRRKTSWHVPVLFVTQREAEADIVNALASGADDYMVKQISQGEFLARVDALGRRLVNQELDFEIGPYNFMPQSQSVLLKHDARQLPDLIRSFRAKGSGLTIGSRWVRGGSAPGTSLPRSLLSPFASLLVARATGFRRVRDVTTSFRVIRPDAADLVATGPTSTGDYGFYCEFVAAAQAYGFSVDEVPITFRPRFTAVPALRLGDLSQFFRDVHHIRARVRSIRAEVAVDQATWAARSGLMRHQAPDTGSQFGALDELTELSQAEHFTDWIVDSFELALGERVLEVGAGLGAIARKIAVRHPSCSVVAIEPASNVFDSLCQRCNGVDNLSTLQVTSGDLDASITEPRFDTVLYVNVLEHIEHDADEITTAINLLEPGGRLCVFVPAMPALYGSLDYKSGHYRRYTAAQLARLLDDAGLTDIDVRYFDLLGVAPYWLMYRVFNVARLDRVSSNGYDRIVVPISRALQRVVRRPPRGKNLIAVARRPG